VLVLDNCSHVIEAAAALAVAILRGAADVHILATSREPLRVEGEYVQRLPPLSSGFPSDHLSAAEALAFPAIELFVERAAERLAEFELTDENAPLVAEICLKLDGIPLAIELAAPRVETFGVRGLATHLDDRFRLLTGGRRSGPPRHRTLRAALDWSYDVLSEPERVVLRRLGIFMGGFTLDAACAVVADPGLLKGDVIDAVAELVEKSLAVVETTETEPRLRLLETTRAYALERLVESGERETIARRHAEYYGNLFERAEGEAAAQPRVEWLADYAPEIDNLRAALDWAFSPSGDASIGVGLTATAVPLWMHLSLMEECRSRVERALANLAPAERADARAEMKLQAALSASLLFTKGATPEVGQASATALHLAESLGDTEYQLRALWELWVYSVNTGEYAAALAVAQKFYALALVHSDPADLPTADRMIGTSYHYLGDQRNAWRHIERMLSPDFDARGRSPFFRFWFDQEVVGRVVLARILWLRGFPDQAWRTLESAVGDAEALTDPATLCYAFCHGGCLVGLWMGNLAAAERYAEMLLDHSRKHGFAAWNDFASRIKGVVLIKTGDLDTGSPLLPGGLEEITDPNSGLWFLTGLGEMADALGRAGRIAEALATVERGIDRSQGGWRASELLRIKGELLLLQGTAGTTEAVEDDFRQALDWARRQETLSWELRAATSLARLLRDRDRIGEARDLLAPIYDRFTEGFGTADLQAARLLLEELTDDARP
jgi:predicted ATPase